MGTDNILGDLTGMISSSMNMVNLAINGMDKKQKAFLKKELKKKGFQDKMKEAKKQFEALQNLKFDGTDR